MEIYYVSANSKGLQTAELLANRVNRRNNLSVIKIGEEIVFNGGFIFPFEPIIKSLFDLYPIEEHYEVAKSIKVDPFVKAYYEDQDV